MPASSCLSDVPFLSQDDFDAICHDVHLSFDYMVKAGRSRETSQQPPADSEKGETGVGDWKDFQVLRTYEGGSYMRIVRSIRRTLSTVLDQNHKYGGDTPYQKSVDDRDVDGTSDGEDLEIEEMEEDDPERLETASPDLLVLPEPFNNKKEDPETTIIIYDIFLSPTYRVPVLYVHATQRPPSSAPGTRQKFTPLSSEALQGLLSSSSETGSLPTTPHEMPALSLVNHPVSDVPVWYVHPCLTADALGEVLPCITDMGSMHYDRSLDERQERALRQSVSGNQASDDARSVGSQFHERMRYFGVWVGLIGRPLGLTMPREMAIGILRS